MKYKKIIALLAGITIGVTGFSTASANTSQTVQASKKDEIFMQGYETKHPYKYFKKWKKVVLIKKSEFKRWPFTTSESDPDWGSEITTKTLKAGQVFKLQSVNEEWRVKGKQFPAIWGYYWFMPDFNKLDKPNSYTTYKDSYEPSAYNFVTTTSYAGVSTLFRHKRKIKVIKNVRADKLKLTQPLAYIHPVKHKTIKKGTVLKATGPTNHWDFKIWGKGLKNTSKYIWTINGKLSGWYKFLD